MELTNELYKAIEPRPARSESWKAIREATEALLQLLSPFAPHLAEELWEALGHDKPLAERSWPAHDPTIAAEDRLTLVVQVNGKLRSRLSIGPDEDDETIKKRALDGREREAFPGREGDRRVVVVPKRRERGCVGMRFAACHTVALLALPAAATASRARELSSRVHRHHRHPHVREPERSGVGRGSVHAKVVEEFTARPVQNPGRGSGADAVLGVP
jgi:hypothetical protein